MEMRERLTEMREMDLQVQSKKKIFFTSKVLNMLDFLTTQIESQSKENL